MKAYGVLLSTELPEEAKEKLCKSCDWFVASEGWQEARCYFRLAALDENGEDCTIPKHSDDVVDSVPDPFIARTPLFRTDSTVR